MTNTREDTRELSRKAIARYWRSNLRIMLVLITVWALAGIGASILFANPLNSLRLPGLGFPLGFWFAHQGSILVFVAVILVYCLLMNRLDRTHHTELKEIRKRRFE